MVHVWGGSLRYMTVTLHEHHGVSNRRQCGCFVHRTTKKIPMLRIIDPLRVKSTSDRWIPFTKANSAETVSKSWSHHVPRINFLRKQCWAVDLITFDHNHSPPPHGVTIWCARHYLRNINSRNPAKSREISSAIKNNEVGLAKTYSTLMTKEVKYMSDVTVSILHAIGTSFCLQSEVQWHIRWPNCCPLYIIIII